MADLLQDPGDLYEFICDPSVLPSSVSTFELVAIQCQFERKYRRSHESATEQELHQFSFSYATSLILDVVSCKLLTF